MTEDLPNNIPPDEEVHLLDYLLVLAKHSQMIVYSSFAAGALVFLILLFFPDQFTAKTQLLPPQQNPTLTGQILDSMNVGGLSASGGGGLGGMTSVLGIKSPNEIYLGILTGNTIFDSIIDRFKLREVYAEEVVEKVRKELSRKTNIELSKEGLISIEVTDEDPKRAAAIANAFGEELDTRLRDLSCRDANNQLVFLDKEREKASRNLTAAEEALREFSERKSVLQLDAQTRGMIEYIAGLRATIDAKEIQIKVLSQQATPMNYDLIRLDTELKGLKEKLQVAESKADQACVGEICISTGKVPSLGLEFVRLYREVKYQETLYQLYVKLVEIARMDTARNFATIQFVDLATIPEKSSKPKRGLISILIVLVMLFAMTSYAFIKEYWVKVAEKPEGARRISLIRTYRQKWSPREKLKSIQILFKKSNKVR